jgi:hypothetical protein
MNEPPIDAQHNRSEPVLSDNGRYIAYWRHGRRGPGGARRPDIFLYDVRNGREIKVKGLNSDTASERSPSLSQSGRYIAFVLDRAGSDDIYLYDRDSGSLVDVSILNDPALDEANPSLSNDGTLIAFEIASFQGERLFDRVAGAFRYISDFDAPGYGDPALSKDGRFLAYTTPFTFHVWDLQHFSDVSLDDIFHYGIMITGLHSPSIR